MYRRLCHIQPLLVRILVLLTTFLDVRQPPLKGESHVIVVLRQSKSITDHVHDHRSVGLPEVDLDAVSLVLAQHDVACSYL